MKTILKETAFDKVGSTSGWWPMALLSLSSNKEYEIIKEDEKFYWVIDDYKEKTLIDKTYFITPAEYRKLKLQKIDEKNSLYK